MGKYNDLESLLRDLRGEAKSAAQKSAEPMSEPGGYQGSSTHPVAKADDGVIPSQTGARSKENESDVKKDIPGKPVDATAEVKGDSSDGTPKQDSVQLNIGTTSSSVGGDPKVEDDYKATKDDPGTSSVMKANDGQKYASMSFQKVAAESSALANEILADIATGKHRDGEKAAEAKPVTDEVKAAAEAGYAAAAAAGQQDSWRKDQATALIEETIKEAAHAADLTAAYLANLVKQASMAEEAGEGEDHSAPGDATSGPNPGGGPGGNPGGGPGGPPGGGPGGPPEGAGGAPPALDGAIAGGAPEATPEQALQELAAALMEMGIDPAQLAAIAAQQGGGPAGPPEGGEPKLASADARKLYKAANAVQRLRREGKFAFTAPKSAQLEELRGQMRAYIAECLHKIDG